MGEPTWDELVDWHLQPAYRRRNACRLATGRSAQFVEKVWQHVCNKIVPPYERATKDGLTPVNAFRFILVKILQFIKYCSCGIVCVKLFARNRLHRCGGAIEQARSTLHMNEERWKKLEITALRISLVIDILNPNCRFEDTNHAPLLPRCVTAIIDSFPKEVMDAACSMPHAACRMLHVACCMLHVACRWHHRCMLGQWQVGSTSISW